MSTSFEQPLLAMARPAGASSDDADDARPRVTADSTRESTREAAADITADITDEEILARLQASDKTALKQLFVRYSRLVHSIGRRILRDRGEAEELVQEAFLYIFRRAKLFDPLKGRARAWITQVAVHRAITRRAHLVSRHFYGGTNSDLLADTLTADTDLEREIGGKLERRQLEQAFEELPENQRRTLELFFFEGLDLREVAGRLGQPLGNVRHHYYRGISKLSKSSAVKKLRGAR